MARRDSNYVVYVASHNGQSYIGITRKNSVTAKTAVHRRWLKHLSRARCEQRDWALYRYIQKGAWTGWSHEVITVIRGRAEAYEFEQGLVEAFQPELNTQYV